MSDHLCPVCGRGELQRCSRRGLWERYVLSLFGVFPWRCGKCRTRLRLSDRGPANARTRTRTSGSSGAAN